MDERLAQIALACATEPGSAGVAAAVAEHGPVAALAAVLSATRAPRSQMAGRVAPEDVPAMLGQLGRLGIRVIIPGDPEFPSQLLDLAEPPLALWVRGPLDLRAAALRSVAVVGARACTPYGERATGLLASGLAEAGWAIVSGGAFGIDAAAHRAALGVDGPTIAVLACGVDVAYPRAHDSLLCRIADTGAVVSELPPGSLPLKHRFLSRNRLIAAVSRGTVIVEAARRSGAIATANRALEIGRVVMAVPGPVTSMASAGTNRLLHEGAARAVADHEEVVSLIVGPGVEHRAHSDLLPNARPDVSDGVSQGIAAPRHAMCDTDGASRGHGASRADGASQGDWGGPADVANRVELTDDARQVLAALPTRGGRTVDQVAAMVGLPPSQCLAHLGLLELAGLGRRTRGGWCRTA